MNQLLLPPKPAGVTLTRWLYDEIRNAILAGRLKRGTRLPASRDLAAHNGISRHIVVNVFEQLMDEGYVTGQIGSGTWIRNEIPDDYLAERSLAAAGLNVAPQAAPTVAQAQYPKHPHGLDGPVRPFRFTEPAVAEFPLAIWNRVASRVLRRTTVDSLARGERAGLLRLRIAIADYLGVSRGVACSPENIIIVSGTQQALFLLAHLVTEPGNPVWLEDPCYSGAVDAFRLSGAKIIPVRVDEKGLDPDRGRHLCATPKAVYLTPAHQFCLGTVLSLERRFDLLQMASAQGTVLIEDDYDSEFRFRGRPVPAMKGLGGGEPVFLLGTFNKILFPALRLGYMVVPDAWVERLLTMRYRSDRYPPTMPQEILAAFIEDGHFVRHLRRMRELYGSRLAALQENVDRYLSGALRLPEIQAGLSTPAYLENGMSSREAAEAAASRNIEAFSLDRYALQRRDLHGVVLGFAAFTERQIRAGVQSLARAYSGFHST